MMKIYLSKPIVLIASLIILSYLSIGCTPIKTKKVTEQKADYYKFTAQNAGLQILIDQYKEENRLQDTFGCDLISRGVLPVRVVIENVSAEDGYILLKEETRLVMKNTGITNGENNLTNYDAANLEEGKTKGQMFSAGNAVGATVVGISQVVVLPILYPAAVIVAVPWVSMGMKHDYDESAIKRNFEFNQFVEKTVYQGAPHSGFLFFPIKRKEDINKIESLFLSMQNVRTKEIVSFVININ